MYISLGSLKDADALTAKMKELIIFPLPTIVLMFLPLFIQITELFHLINAACEGTAERLRSRKCTSTSKHKIQSPPPHQHHHHPKTNKHTEQRGIHHRCFWFDKSLCFSITIISPELDKGSGRGWKMETQWIWPATKRKLPPPLFFFPPALRLEMIALHRSCKGVGDYILILQLTLLEAPFEWNPRVLSKKPYYGNDLTRGGEEKRYSKLLLDFFFSSRVAGKDHKTMKNNGLTASKKVSDWAPNTAHHVMCVSELSPGFGLKLHQISRWLTGNHQHKAARISPHYVAANCAASHDFTQTMFLFPGMIKKRTIKSIVQSRIATSIEFPDQSHLKPTRSAGAARRLSLLWNR